MVAPAVSKHLRSVQTVEKRAFRVGELRLLPLHFHGFSPTLSAGRVVGDHDPERAEFSLTKLIGSFNTRYLRHVKVVEHPPAFPVGRESVEDLSMPVIILTFDLHRNRQSSQSG